MKKYRVTLYYHTNITVEVQAENEQDAEVNAGIEASKKEYDQAILSGLERDSSPDIVEIETHDDNMVTEADTAPVVSITEKDGQQWVRVRVGDEDFLITSHDYKKDGKDKFTWEEACKIGTFTKRQAHIACAFLDEINGKLREIGGEELDDVYWSSTEYNVSNAWGVGFGSGYIGYYSKCHTGAMRPVAAF